MQEYVFIMDSDGNARGYKVPQEVHKVWWYKHFTTEDNITAGMRFVFGTKRVRR